MTVTQPVPPTPCGRVRRNQNRIVMDRASPGRSSHPRFYSGSSASSADRPGQDARSCPRSPSLLTRSPCLPSGPECSARTVPLPALSSERSRALRDLCAERPQSPAPAVRHRGAREIACPPRARLVGTLALRSHLDVTYRTISVVRSTRYSFDSRRPTACHRANAARRMRSRLIMERRCRDLDERAQSDGASSGCGPGLVDRVRELSRRRRSNRPLTREGATWRLPRRAVTALEARRSFPKRAATSAQNE